MRFSSTSENSRKPILKLFIIIFFVYCVLGPEVCDVTGAVKCGFDLVLTALKAENIQLK